MTDIGNRYASMRLQCQRCGWSPPEDATMEAVQLHMQVDHDTDDVKLELVAVCSCGAAMTHTETKPTGGGFKDYVKCGACGNTGHVTSPDIPPQAITAAANELHKPCICSSEASHEEQMAWATQTATAVLEAAAPYLAAAVPAGVIHIEGTKLSEADVEELAGRWRAAWHKGEHKILPDDTEARIAEAVAAERERCAQLADSVGAIYPLAPSAPEVTVDGEPVPVTAGNVVIWPDGMPAVGLVSCLLRQGGEGGGT